MLIKLEVLIWYLMMHKNRKWVDSPHTRQWRYLKNEREEPIKGQRWGTSQKPSEG